MFKTNSQKIQTISAALAAAGLNVESILSAPEGSNPVQAAIDAAVESRAEARAEELAESMAADEVNRLTAASSAAQQQAQKATANLDNLVAALGAAGLSIAADASAEKVKETLEAAISKKAATVVSSTGTPTPPANPAGAEGGNDDEPQGFVEKTHAYAKADSPAAKEKLYREMFPALGK